MALNFSRRFFLSKISISAISSSRNLFKCSHQLALNDYFDVLPSRIEEIEKSPSGWVPPLAEVPKLPFYIKRSRTNNVPVYTDMKSGGSRVLTIVRKISGDLEEFEKFVKCVLGDDTICQINEITSCIKIKGNHQKTLMKALQEVGF